ncbi:hypothetical protein BDR07DRAFT_1498094 [Suillus spraguei]|nr:hypothetical protein BDR07DRAFT_1498094 [Suillus spraguei]
MSQQQPYSDVVAVANRPPSRERAGTPLVGYPTSVHASRPLRSSPLVGLAFSSNPSIASSDLDGGPYLRSRSQPSSIISHTGSLSASTSSHAHRVPRPLAGPSKSAGTIPTLGLDARPYSRSSPSSVVSHTGSLSASSSSFSSFAHRTPTIAPAKSTGAIPTLSLFRRQVKDEPAAPPPTQASFGHNRATSFPCHTAPPPAHVPQAYSPSVARPSQQPSVSRNPKDNWMSSSPFGPASTPRFSRQSMSSQPVVMPLSAREYRRRKCASMMTDTVYLATSGSPVTEDMGKEGVPHIIVSDSEASGPSPSVPTSGNRPSRRASLPSSGVSRTSFPLGSREPALSEKSSKSTFFSLSSENEAENAVITVVDPGVMPRRRMSHPNPTQRHSRISLVDAVNRLSQMSEGSGDTISVTEDDGVLRRASSRKKILETPSHEPLMADAAAESTAPQERTRVVRILEASEVSSNPVLDSDPSDDRDQFVSGDMSTERASKVDSKAPGTSSTEAPVRIRRKLTKPRTQSAQVPSARLAAPSSPWIPRPPAPFFRGSAKQNTSDVSTSDVVVKENAPQTEEIEDNGKENKHRSRRLTFQFIPSPSFHKQPKSPSSIAPGPDLKSPMKNDTRHKIPKPDSRYGPNGSLSSLAGSATTITLLPPPPITFSSSASSSAGNSTPSLTDGSSTTMGSRDTSATSINVPGPQTASRSVEYPYPKVPSNLKQSMVAQWSSDTESDQQDISRRASKTFVDPSASRDQEVQESSSSFCTITSYASFSSFATSGSAPAVLDAKNAPNSSCNCDQALDRNVHPMWTVPMVTITATSLTAPPPRAKEIPPVVQEPQVAACSLAVPVRVPTSRRTARLKRPHPHARPQTAPTTSQSPTPPTSKSPRATRTSSKFKSIFCSLLGRTG